MIRSFNWRHPAVLLGVACSVAFAWLVQRHLGLNPAVFGDEWYYSKMSRLVALREAALPSYLYLWLFGASSACGDGFLDCVRIGNTLLFVAAAPLVYLTARVFTSKRLALFVAGLALLAPMSMYNGFFMPEATYNFGFWGLSWIALTRTRWRPARRALACGTVLGLLSLVKVHALFLLPALCLFLLYEHWRTRAGRPWLRDAVLALALAAASALATKFALGYLFAGESGLTLFGSLYAGSVNDSVQRQLPAMVAAAIVTLRGHVMALAVLFALPLALALHGLAGQPADPAQRAAATAPARLYCYLLLMLAAALGMTVLYTASIATPNNHEMLRLHLRYYDFLFPLLTLACAVWLAHPPSIARPRLRIGLALLLAALLACALAKLPAYAHSMIDGPDISAVDLRRPSGLLLLALQLAALVLWAAGRVAGPRLFLFAVAPAALLMAASAERHFLRALVPATGSEVDAAAAYAHHVIPRNELAQTTVAATGWVDLYRILFHLDDARVKTVDLPPSAPVDAALAAPGSTWLLVTGEHALSADCMPVASGKGYKLARILPRELVGSARLGGALPNGVVEAVRGFSMAEGWGRWSDGKQVRIQLSTPLPPSAAVVLEGVAYGPNAAQPFTLRAGDDSAGFTMGAIRRRVALHLKTDGTVRELTIEVPRPVSPQALGQSPDRRELGLGLAGLEILVEPAAVASLRAGYR